MRSVVIGVLAMWLAVLAPTVRAQASGSASQPVVRGMLNLDASRVAVRGYDVVAYFEDGQPTKGSDAHVVRWRGGRFHFATEAHADAFRADPEHYAPRFGGYCAWAVSQGYVADADPSVWAIVEDRLYLNYDAGVKERWDADREALISRGESHWPRVLRR